MRHHRQIVAKVAKCLLVLLSIAVIFLVTCSPANPIPPGAVTDDLGRPVNIEKIPQRIISLSPSNTEILFALGLGEKVVGVTEFCDYPPKAKDKEKIGGFSTPDIEKIIALEPDLILAGSIHDREIIPALEERGFTIFALAPKNLDEILEDIRIVGEITGKAEEAFELVAQMESRIGAVTDKTKELERSRVFYITWHDPLRTAGGDTWHEELIVKAGGINIAHDLTGYATISLETVIAANPQVIITGAGMGTGVDLPLQFAKTEERLRNVDARINNRVYAVPTDLSGRPGPRIVDALEQFAESIHPELFEED